MWLLLCGSMYDEAGPELAAEVHSYLFSVLTTLRLLMLFIMLLKFDTMILTINIFFTCQYELTSHTSL